MHSVSLLFIAYFASFISLVESAHLSVGPRPDSNVPGEHPPFWNVKLKPVSKLAQMPKDVPSSGGIGGAIIPSAPSGSSGPHIASSAPVAPIHAPVVPACHADRSGRCSIDDVVILGGGPAGSMVALVLKKLLKVKRVRVIEKRTINYSRPVHFNVRSALRQMFSMLGLERSFLAEAGILKKEPAPQYTRDPDLFATAINDFESIIRQPSIYQIMSKDLERLLAGTAQIADVKYDFSADIPEDCASHIRSIKERQNPDLIIVATGGRGCNIFPPRRELGEASYYIAGQFQKHIGGISISRPFQVNGRVFRNSIAGFSKPEKKSVWCVVQVPSEAQRWSPEEVKAKFLERVRMIFPELNGANLIWGGAAAFPVQAQIADKFTEDNVISVGDVVGVAHFYASAGVMAAGVGYPAAVKKLVEQARSEGFAQAIRDFIIHAHKIAEAWIDVSTRPVNHLENDASKLQPAPKSLPELVAELRASA